MYVLNNSADSQAGFSGALRYQNNTEKVANSTEGKSD